MTLPENVADRIYQSFTEDAEGNVVRRTDSSKSGLVLSTNSSLTPLGSAGEYTGTWVDVSTYSSVVVACKADQSGTIFMEFNHTDSGTAPSSLSYDVAANINEVHRLTITRPYFRVRYVNGSTAQSTFEVTSMAGEQTSLAAPANLTMGQDADATVARVIEAEQDIAEGKRAGYTIVNKFGRNPDIDTGTTPEDIWFGGGIYTGFPVGDDELITVVSSSANDTSAGSGARTIQIDGLDSDGMEQSETLTLNGTTKVNSVNTFTRVHRAFALTSGSSNQAFNAGNLTVQHLTTTANIFLTVPAGRNQSQVAAYTIPANKTGYLKKIDVTMKRSNTANADGGLWVRNNGASPRVISIFSLSQTDKFTENIYGGYVLPALTDVALRIFTVSANNTEVTAEFDMVLVNN